jgi:excisionase family DNA binding protein
VPATSKLHDLKNLPWQARGALSVEHAAEILGLSRKDAYRQIGAGRIVAVRIGDRRMIVPVAEIFRLLGMKAPRRPGRRPLHEARGKSPSMRGASAAGPAMER